MAALRQGTGNDRLRFLMQVRMRIFVHAVLADVARTIVRCILLGLGNGTNYYVDVVCRGCMIRNYIAVLVLFTEDP